VYGRQSFRFGPPETPEIIKQLMIANAVVFGLQLISPPSFSDLAAVRPSAVWGEGYFWQPFTYMWLHGGFMHIAMNCFALWMFGSELAMVWGKERFLRFYLMCGIGSGFVIATWPFVLLFAGVDVDGLDTHTLGASGAIYGVVLGYSLMWPDRRIALIFPPISFRAIWLIPGLLVMTIAMSGPEGGISHIGHLGGVLVGWLYLRQNGLTSGSDSSQASRTVGFKSNVLQRRLRRWRMRKKLRAVPPEKTEQRPKDRDHKGLH